MDRKENNKKITAIVPAYNEAVRIKHVLDVLTTYPGFSDIIIIDDGSTDNTEDVVKKYPVNYIKNSSNQGVLLQYLGNKKVNRFVIKDKR